MPWISMEILAALPVFALVLFRLSGLMLTGPVLSSTVIPRQVRIAFTAVLALMLFPVVRGQAPADLTLSMVMAGAFGELIIGVTIGLGLALLFTGVEVGGLMIGQQAGIALGRVFNPIQNQQTTLTGQVYSLVLVLVFLLAGGHRAMIAALLDTFEVIPMLSRGFDSSVVVLLAEMLASAFILAIRLAAPVLIALMMTSLALGFLSRTMPQLNILSVGFQVRLMVGLSVAALAIGASEDVMLGAIWDGLEAIRTSFGLDPIHG